jgi:hypothetical protein
VVEPEEAPLGHGTHALLLHQLQQYSLIATRAETGSLRASLQNAKADHTLIEVKGAVEVRHLEGDAADAGRVRQAEGGWVDADLIAGN